MGNLIIQVERVGASLISQTQDKIKIVKFGKIILLYSILNCLCLPQYLVLNIYIMYTRYLIYEVTDNMLLRYLTTLIKIFAG